MCLEIVRRLDGARELRAVVLVDHDQQRPESGQRRLEARLVARTVVPAEEAVRTETPSAEQSEAQQTHARPLRVPRGTTRGGGADSTPSRESRRSQRQSTERRAHETKGRGRCRAIHFGVSYVAEAVPGRAVFNLKHQKVPRGTSLSDLTAD